MNTSLRARRTISVASSALVLTLSLAACANNDTKDEASSDWPTQKIELVVPFEPGGGTDIAARRFAKELESSTGQSVVVVNKPGGGGTVGIGEVAGEKADGYTMGLSIDSIMTLQPQLTGNEATSIDHFKAIGLSKTAFILVAKADAPWDDLEELADAAEADPGELRISAPGNGTTNDLAARAFALATDTTFTHTPFAGGGIEAVNAVLNGQVELASTTIAVVKGLVEAGQLKVVGVLDDEEIASFPDIPTLSDAGIESDLIMQSQAYLVFPEATPDDVLANVEDAVQEVLEDDAYIKAVQADGSSPSFSSVSDSAEQLKDADEAYGELLAQIPELGKK